MSKTIVGELKDLYVKMGGSLSDLSANMTTSEILDAIETIYNDKGDTLPEVTTDDNGDVLTVVNGGWDKSTVPTNELVVTYTTDNDVTTGDKTFAEISTAIAAGKTVKAQIYSVVGQANSYQYAVLSGFMEGVMIEFTNNGVDFETSKETAVTIYHASSDSVTLKTYTAT